MACIDLNYSTGTRQLNFTNMEKRSDYDTHSMVMLLLIKITGFKHFPSHILEMSSHSFAISVVHSYGEAQNKSAQVFLESIITNTAFKKNYTLKIAF